VLIKRGHVLVANFNPSKGTEAGKVRPCLVIQTDLLNDVGHPSTTVLPLTTRILDDAEPLRYRVSARDALKQDSDLMLDQMRTIDNRRFRGESLTHLDDAELIEIELRLKILLGLD
jgi:mRNA interferase MazF